MSPARGKSRGKARGPDKRLEERVRQDLATIINYKLNDPRISMVTITKVELLQDNTFGRVFYSAIATDVQRRTLHRALVQARGRIQELLGRTLSTRHTPKLSFFHDPGIEKSVRIGQILRRLEDEREPPPAGEVGAVLDDGDGDGPAGGPRSHGDDE